MRPAILLLLLVAAPTLRAQPSRLSIVVLDGENAVNIIQQKTAVRALVEVRDQNNLPVAGASVTFAVTGKGGAAVAGSQTVSVVTNAAGQASLAGMTPVSAGGLQISVNATFSSLTATTTITQSVVTTVAAATAAGTVGGAAAGAAGGAAGAAGGAAGGAAVGGGLSTGAIAGIVGGVAAVGGGVAAAGASDTSTSSSGGSGSSGTDPTGGSGPAPTGLLPSCEFAVSPEDILVGNEGGTVALTITMTSVGQCYDPSWGVDVGNAASWISVSPRSGSGSGAAVVTIAPYVPTPSAPNRVATIIVAYERILISQPCRCPMSALQPLVSFRSAPQPAAGSAARDDR